MKAISADFALCFLVLSARSLARSVEYANWVTLRSQCHKTVGQDHYNRWDLRQEIEYGVTDRYTAVLDLNEQTESYRDPSTGVNASAFMWQGVSLENRFNVLKPDDARLLNRYLDEYRAARQKR